MYIVITNMSKDLRKLTEDSRNNRLVAENATGNGYFELNKSPYSYSATIPNTKNSNMNDDFPNTANQSNSKPSTTKSASHIKENPIKSLKPTPLVTSNNQERPATRLV